MRKRKLEDIEYNVYKNNSDDMDNGFLKGGKGCSTIIFGILIIAAIIFIVVGVLKSSTGSAVHCAYPGCAKSPAIGSNYCWQHSASYSGRRGKRSNNAEVKEKESSGSITDNNSSATENESKPKEQIPETSQNETTGTYINP